MKKKSSKDRGKTPSTGNSGVVRLVLGYGFILLALGLVIALVSHASNEERNLLGPFWGTMMASNVSLLFGKFPLLFLLPSLALTGVRLLWRNPPFPLLRILMGLWILTLMSSLGLALRIESPEAATENQLLLNGGVFGVFLVRQLMEPLFGSERFVPVVFVVIGSLLVFVFSFGLRPNHLIPFIEQFHALMREGWHRLLRSKRQPAEIARSTPNIRIYRNEETSDFPVMRRGKVEPFQESKLQLPPVALESLKAKPFTERSQVASAPLASPQLLSEGERNANIRRIEALLLQSPHMDPREVRRFRDELAEMRRASEINAWEDRKAGELKIDGLVKSELTVEEQTLVAPKVKSRPVQDPQVQEKTIVNSQESDFAVLMPETPIPVMPPREDLFADHSGEYRVPRVSNVLADVPEQPIDYSQEELKQFGTMLEQQLENFRVKGKVVQIATGPVITRFEIEPGPGVKVSRFAGLSDDLALALKANSIRVLAPIPGKSVVGIEIPNRKAQTVFCREILESPRFTPDPYTLQIVLGKDIMGAAFVMDLARAPHLLIAGQTGSGKSVCINTLMASLLFSKSPDDLRMILVDPKVVELKSYEHIPHLLHPVVTDPGTAVQALQWACFEMDRRYELLAKAGVRNITGFNQKVASGEIQKIDGIQEKDRMRMPFIVIVVDEFADVIMQAKKEFEDPVIRLAQKARAAGMHMVLATQRPSTNVITGIIKANLPTRISFKVASHIDARTVLDHAGAEKLLGRGDMLFRSIDDPEPVRVHGAFLSDTDAEKVALACAEQDVNYPQLSSFLVANAENAGGMDAMDAPDQDELFWEAAEQIALSGGGSTSWLQRRFAIGYARAGRLMDQLFRAGVVGPERGSKPREPLMGLEEIANLRRTRGV